MTTQQNLCPWCGESTDGKAYYIKHNGESFHGRCFSRYSIGTCIERWRIDYRTRQFLSLMKTNNPS